MPALRIAALLLFPVTLTAQQPERRRLAGDHVAIYNLAGVMRLERGTGGDVVAELTRGGPDAGKLEIATGPVRGREALRVIYPDDEIVYRVLGRGSNTTVHVRDDGTFNDRDDQGRHRGDEGRRVRITSSGSGLEAHADLRIAIPAGKRVEVYLAVGQAFASNVDGDPRVDVAAANMTADHVKGSLLVDTGSGDVRLSDAQGDVSLDTGSGNVTVSGVSGRELKLDTGSGDVTAERVRDGRAEYRHRLG
ncbi:MAG TPA: DUF4097 family beta strand repeat-containing protein [Gemmatimonadales bacterium]